MELKRRSGELLLSSIKDRRRKTIHYMKETEIFVCMKENILKDCCRTFYI